MALTWLRGCQECEDTHSDSSLPLNFEEDITEMEMWKCLLQVETEMEVTAIPCSVLKFCTLQRLYEFYEGI